MKFLICAPHYDPQSGGAVVLHKLCSVLNELGHEAWLTPFPDGMPAYRDNFIEVLRNVLRWKLQSRFTPYPTRPDFRTPVLRNPQIAGQRDWITIYPESVFGNPLGGANVVRWLLFRPGAHTGRVFFGQNELLVDFNEFARDFSFPGSHKAPHSLYVLSFPFDSYNLHGALPAAERHGTAYTIRKGTGKPLVHDTQDAILIDGRSHTEIATIFKRVKTFISYDPHTAFLPFAALCGADAVAIPDPGVSRDTWYTKDIDRYGVAYGFEDLAWARSTAHLVEGAMREKEARSVESVRQFVTNAQTYFGPRMSAGAGA